MIASLTMTAEPPTRTALTSPSFFSTSSSMKLGRLISNPCSSRKLNFPFAALSRAAR